LFARITFFFKFLSIFLDVVKQIFPRGSGGDVYLVEEKESKKHFVLKGTSIVHRSILSDHNNNDSQKTTEKEEFIKKKEKFEELINSWKKANKKTEYIVKCIDHWYDEKSEYIYILMEYCSGGDLAIKILKKTKENEKFTEDV
jgi:serine/threonine protein kinase